MPVSGRGRDARDAQARWQRVSDLYNDALELPPQERLGFLETACGEDLRREIAELLDAEDRDGAFSPRTYFSLRPEPDEVGRRVGPYRLVRRIARGGMGTVYLAERADGEIEQQVAFKLLRRGHETDELLRRFRVERQLLANLDHPNVTRLLDAGSDAGGRPYLVMEYVRGLPIDRHCDEHRLSTRERVRLFRSLCEAVRFVHRNATVHRDLKPDNVLVTADGTVKLLDFGIAKLLPAAGRPPRDDPRFTLTATRRNVPLTPRYASPEQFQGHVDTTSDVYSLGVVLYEILAGHRAHRHAASELEVVRAVCEETPPRPSLAAARPAAGPDGEEELAPEEIARRRGTDPRRLRRELAGDLDNIVMKALRKKPERRFSSVEQLSEDLRRYLEGLPVLSRPDTLAYRTGKLVRRHPRSFLAAAAAGAVLAGLLAFVLAQSFEISRLNREFPLGRARLLDEAGVSYRHQGRWEKSREALEAALALRRERLAPDDPEIAESLHNLASLERELGNLDAAQELMEDALAIQRQAFPYGHQDLALGLDLARGLNNFASFLRARDDLDAAAQWADESLAMKKCLGAREVATSLNTLGGILKDQGESERAETLFREAVGSHRLCEKSDPGGLSAVLNNLALLLVDRLDRPEEALPLLEESLRLRREVYGDGHSKVANGLNSLAVALTMTGEHEKARTGFDAALDIAEGVSGLVIRKNKAMLLSGLGEYDACGRLTRDLQRLKRAAWIADAKSIRGHCLAGLGRRDEAEPLLREGYETLRQELGEDARQTRQAGERLAAFLAAAPSLLP